LRKNQLHWLCNGSGSALSFKFSVSNRVKLNRSIIKKAGAFLYSISDLIHHRVKYFYPLIFSIGLFGCNGNKSGHAGGQDNPSNRTFTTAEQLNVIGDINFGITKSEFEKIYQKFLAAKGCKSGCTIGKFEYFKEHAKFKNDQLYYLEFANVGLKYDGYDKSIPEILADAFQFAKSEYGMPDKAQPLSAWKQGQSFTAYTWRIGKKTVEIKVDRIEMQFGVRILIYRL